MTKEDIVRDLEKNIYCRIKKSPIEGVGVFAIRKIPAGTDPFAGQLDVPTVPVPEKEILDNPKISEAVKEMIKAFYVFKDGNIECPAHSLNEINISYFMNFSKTPNTSANSEGGEITFVANRDIEAGEELTSDYSTFSDL